MTIIYENLLAVLSVLSKERKDIYVCFSEFSLKFLVKAVFYSVTRPWPLQVESVKGMQYPSFCSWLAQTNFFLTHQAPVI